MRLSNHYVIILPGSRGYEKVDYKSASAVYEYIVVSYIYQPRGEIILMILDLGQSSGTVGTDPASRNAGSKIISQGCGVEGDPICAISCSQSPQRVILISLNSFSTATKMAELSLKLQRFPAQLLQDTLQRDIRGHFKLVAKSLKGTPLLNPETLLQPPGLPGFLRY
jgi:hypothetical protein